MTEDENCGGADTQTAPATQRFWHRTRRNARISLKFYASASRLALGESRWIAASGALGALSLGLVGIGMATLVTPYQGVAVASLTADRAPRVVALDLTPKDVDGPRAVVAIQPTDELYTASLADPGLFTGEMAEEAVAEIHPAEPREVEVTVALASGETLMEVLAKAGADRIDAYHAVAALSAHYSPRKLRAGQEISLNFMEMPEGAESAEDSAMPPKYLTALSLQPDIERAIEVTRDADGSFSGRETMREFSEGFVRAAGTIDNSLFLDGERAGLPPQIIVEMIRMYSYSVDFQREIQPGDKFEVYFSRKFDENNVAVKEGDVLFASLSVGGKTHKLWRHDPGDGVWDYFDENGQSMKKFLMKTPVDGARLSSGFGMRKHPILGYSRLHAGVDFAAPTGTPIYAAGDGTVTRANRFGGYGNYVSIRHANGYETAYAHLNGFARGIRAGTRVRQGQVIGYVGTTGASTGPHLHYEVHLNGKKMNPLALKVPTGRKLEGPQLAAFKAEREMLANRMAEAPLATRVARADAETNSAN
ncbi:M23 family metallopeptidase [Parvibaculum sp.]|uniref:M23 family metallopeptidase n=1 Tax=Parvibaculum sp. TaxID=2024848 RepID=UPI001E124DA9|nr:M23 family metallopeptidase [Parvibaculum sp.]MBX3489286.1 M23 family metallopeptidase [Parvibaculum sp.]MCW5726758.1 M23 family metallopeptidase [Parvibaculum sp.]